MGIKSRISGLFSKFGRFLKTRILRLKKLARFNYIRFGLQLVYFLATVVILFLIFHWFNDTLNNNVLNVFLTLVLILTTVGFLLATHLNVKTSQLSNSLLKEQLLFNFRPSIFIDSNGEGEKGPFVFVIKNFGPSPALMPRLEVFILVLKENKKHSTLHLGINKNLPESLEKDSSNEIILSEGDIKKLHELFNPNLPKALLSYYKNITKDSSLFLVISMKYHRVNDFKEYSIAKVMNFSGNEDSISTNITISVNDSIDSASYAAKILEKHYNYNMALIGDLPII